MATFGRGRRVNDPVADDFARWQAGLAGQYSPARLGNEVRTAWTVFRYGTESGLVEKSIRFGSESRKPYKKTLRPRRVKFGRRTFATAEVRALAEAAGVPLRGMILFGVNCGFGSSDAGTCPSPPWTRTAGGDVLQAQDRSRAAG